jgi:hypothetical protein
MGLPELIVNISSQVVKVVKHILLLLMGSRQAWNERKCQKDESGVGLYTARQELRHRSHPLIEPQISLPIPQRQIYGHGWCMERYNIILVRCS